MAAQMTIDTSVYIRNLEHIIETMRPAKVMAVVKADAYGHGLQNMAKAAESAGVDMLGVLDIETGLEMRRAGVMTPGFAWLHSPQSDFKAAIANDIELSVSSLQELDQVAAAGHAKVHLKIDTGLSRNGCRPENWENLVAKAMSYESEGRLSISAIWSHLAGASRASDLEAVTKFENAVETAKQFGFKGYRHIASSPAAFSLPESRFDLVRIGVSAFGTSPVSGQSASSFGLQAPMTLRTEVTASQEIGIGFLHGYFSGLSGKSKVVISGEEIQVLEVGPLKSRIAPGDYEIGDSVLVFGSDGPTAESLCDLVETVTDELFTGLKVESFSYTA